MPKQALPVVLISILTLVVWLFAEAESLTEVQTNVRLRFESFGEPPELLASPQNFDENISLTLRGSRGAIQRARTLLDSAVVLRPGDTGVPDVDGVFPVSVRDALEAFEPLTRTGVVIESVRPRTVEVRVDEIVEVQIPITPDLSGIVTQGEVTVSPDRARVRAPKRFAAGANILSLTALVNPERVDGATTGPRTETVPLRLPGTLEDEPGVSLLTERATVAFTLRSTIEPRTFPSVPVQVLLTTQSARRWEIAIDDRQQLIPVTLVGPAERLAQIGGANARLVAVLALSDIELSRGDTEKPVSLSLLRDDVPSALPDDIEIRGDLPIVRFTSTRLDTEEGE
ncbi:MAG: hypothetical protein AAGH64_02480 [Planctomycetota bacterium]